MARLRPVLFGVLCALGVANACRADVLTDAIPSDAKVVVILGDAKELESKIKSFTQELGFPIPPEVDLKSLLSTFGVPDVWEVEKGLAFVMVEPSPAGVAFVIPSKDPAKALEALNAEETEEEGIYTAQLGGMDVFLDTTDGALIVAINAAALEEYDDPEETLSDVLTEDHTGVREDMDLFVYVDVEAFRPMALEGLEQAAATIEQLPQGPDGGITTPAMASVMGKEFLRAARSLIEQTDVVYGGLYLSEGAIHLEIDVDFTENSYLAKSMKESGKPAKEFFTDLPDLPFSVVMAGELEPFRGLINDTWAVVVKAVANEDAEAAKALAGSMKYLKDVKSLTMLSGFDGDGNVSVGRFETDAPDALLKEIVKAALNSNDFNRVMMPNLPKPTHKKKKVEGIDVDEIIYDLSDVGEDPAIQASLKSMVGEDMKLRSQMAIIDGGVVFAQGGKEDSDPITLYLQKERLISEGRIQEIVEELPDEPTGVVLFDIFGLFGTIKQVAEQSGAPIPFSLEAPEELPPPIALSLTIEDEGLSADVAVPAKLVRVLVSLIMQGMQDAAPPQP